MNVTPEIYGCCAGEVRSAIPVFFAYSTEDKAMKSKKAGSQFTTPRSTVMWKLIRDGIVRGGDYFDPHPRPCPACGHCQARHGGSGQRAACSSPHLLSPLNVPLPRFHSRLITYSRRISPHLLVLYPVQPPISNTMPVKYTWTGFLAWSLFPHTISRP